MSLQRNKLNKTYQKEMRRFNFYAITRFLSITLFYILMLLKQIDANY